MPANAAPSRRARLLRWLRRPPTGPLTPDAIDWHERFAVALDADDLRRATAICRAALTRHETAGWWLRLARCQAERGFYVDALDAIERAAEREGATAEIRGELARISAEARRVAGRAPESAAARLERAAGRLEHRWTAA